MFASDVPRRILSNVLSRPAISFLHSVSTDGTAAMFNPQWQMHASILEFLHFLISILPTSCHRIRIHIEGLTALTPTRVQGRLFRIQQTQERPRRILICMLVYSGKQPKDRRKITQSARQEELPVQLALPSIHLSLGSVHNWDTVLVQTYYHSLSVNGATMPAS
jgi:hypothetical protein